MIPLNGFSWWNKGWCQYACRHEQALSLEWSVGYEMLNLTWLMVPLCSLTPALTADLTAECTEEERGATLCRISSAHGGGEPLSQKENSNQRETCSITHVNMRKVIHTGTVTLVYKYTLVL